METQVNSVVRSCYFQLRKIRRIKRYLTQDALKTLVQSLVISRLDYGNALLAGAPGTIVKKLQRVQNMAARLITGLRKYDHITSTMYELHWLPVDRRIEFKVLLLTYKGLNGSAPGYISDLLDSQALNRSLRPRGDCLLSPHYTSYYRRQNIQSSSACALE